MTMSNWPVLYKQTSTGKVQQWKVSVEESVVFTEYGLVDGKLQTTVDRVKEGKNLGRSNETTPDSQALLQAQQCFDGKLKEGYVENKDVAATTKNTLDAIEPMLAHPIEKKEKYVTYPALGQPKLDGLRCIAIMKNGKVRLFSRTQKEYKTLPHIIAEIETLFGEHKNLILDGELYNHSLKKDFNKITSLIKRDEVHPSHKDIQYHIYDVVAKGSYPVRTNPLQVLSGDFCKKVETVLIESRVELEKYQALCVEKGYEGCMYRRMDAEYEHKRSSGLLKVKSFVDAEFKIVDMEEGCGKLMGKVGAFYCEIDGQKFKAKPACTEEQSQDYWIRKTDCIGKMATIKYQNLTPAGIPRFPILKTIIDYDYR